MQNNDLIRIHVSRVLPAQKWRVIRLVTKAWEFPSYMPNVKEATVIQKSHNKVTTKWKIQVDTIPITWVEEDTLNIRRNRVSFKAIEGDMQEFWGDWHFKEHPEGTFVSVEVNLRENIPLIKDFARAYLEKLLTKNFETMLESLEKRLISLKYVDYKHGASDKIAGFGVIGHPYNFRHLERAFKVLNPGFKMPSLEFITQLFNISPSMKLYDIPNFKSKTGQTVNGCFILATFIPDMVERDMWTVLSKVIRACKVAEKYGIGVVTLGGFTSIVGERIGHQITQEVDIPITTGNTFTAAMAIEGVLKASGLLDLDISSAKVAIIGGTGDIGSGCARVMAEKVKQVTITGRTKVNLQKMGAELKKKKMARIIATTDNKAAVTDADIIIAVASVTASILDISWFKPGAIICDVGYPKNISYAPVKREDILIFSGGLAKSPTPITLPIDLGLPSPDTLYGCFSEGIILSLEKRFENYSFGRGNIMPEKIEEIGKMGEKHGFAVSDFYWGDKLVDMPMLDNIKKAVKV